MALPRGTTRLALGLAASALTAAVTLMAAQPMQNSTGASCPVQTTAAVTPNLPADVCIPDGTTDVPMEYFDDYSWKSFLAMVWPAAEGRRGVPDPRKKPGDAGPLVFETYKSLWEVFHPDGSAPNPAFNVYDRAEFNACHVTPRWGDMVIGSFSGIDDIGQAGVGMLEGPLPAQNGRYVRTHTLFNETQFNFIVQNDFYLRSALPEVPSPRPATPVMNFPMGAIAIKSAWLNVDGLPEAVIRRLYTRQAILKDPTTGTCSTVRVGLVGLHIAQKTPSRPQWIWTSFEHEDNVPPARPNAPGQLIFHDGTRGTGVLDLNPLKLVPLAPEPAKPFNVTRSPIFPVHTATDLMNYKYQALLRGTPWEFYRIVVTQWPRLEGNQAVPVPASQDGSVPHTFPGLGAASAFANMTMETFDQRSVQLGCMNCHNRVRMTTDFMWTVADHAYPATLGPTPAAGGK